MVIFAFNIQPIKAASVLLPAWIDLVLTSLIALLKVASPSLYRGALTAVIEAVTGAASLLNPIPTGHRTRGPFRPRRPSIICIVASCRGIQLWIRLQGHAFPYLFSHPSLRKKGNNCPQKPHASSFFVWDKGHKLKHFSMLHIVGNIWTRIT